MSKWIIDPAHSEVEFKVRHMMITNVRGRLGQLNGSIEGEDFTQAPISLSIEVAGIHTNNQDRDNHLKSAEFFHVEQFPHIQFTAKSVENLIDNNYKVTGDLTIKDVTKPVTFDVSYGGINKDPWGNEKAGFSVNGKINRSEFGLNWNTVLETGGVMVSDEVKLSAELQFSKQI